MRVIEPKSKLVCAGLIQQEEAFKDSDGVYFIVLDMQKNYFNCSVRPDTELNYDSIWVFNVNTCTLGVLDEDEMVEPVELEVIVKGKE